MIDHASVNTMVRVNVAALSRCRPGDDFQRGLTWLELYQHINLFWDLQKEYVLENITTEQKREKRYLQDQNIRLTDPYLSVCDLHRRILIPDSIFSLVTSKKEVLQNEHGERKYEDANATPSTERYDPQLRITGSALCAKFLVLAAPGTGKTETVLRRLKHLSEHELRGDLSPVLAVSYSRAAAAEMLQRLMDRLESFSNQSIYQAPTIATIDSFAGKVLSTIGVTLANESYDDNIRFLALVLEGEKGEDSQSRAAALLRQQIKVVVIDEVQDIVGVRARLVSAILRILKDVPCGITILGDLRQSIYGFNLENAPPNEQRMDAFWLVKELRIHHSEVERVDFVDQHRFSPTCRRLMEQLQGAMDDPTGEFYPGENPDRARLVQVFEEIPRLDDPIELAGSLTKVGDTAILARSNHEVYQLAVACVDLLRGNGKSIRVITSSTRTMFPGWIGRVFGRKDGASQYTADSFCRVYQQFVRNNVDEAKDRLEWLSAAFGISSKGFSKSDILHRLKPNASVPTDLREQARTGEICISTIHQAKGRQYDTVVIVDPAKLLREGDQKTTAENCRLAYVAATRAKRAVFQCGGIEWLPPIFEWNASLHLDLDACNDVDEATWSTLQNELWHCYQSRGSFRLHSLDAATYVLEVQGSKIHDTWPIRLNSKFTKEFADYARKFLKTDHPIVQSFTVRITGLRTVCTSVVQQRIAFIPELSGEILKAN